jgi:ERCC4-type nuclease
MLAAVPGVSAVTGRALLERFGSISALIAAGPEAWRSVPGVGAERAVGFLLWEIVDNPVEVFKSITCSSSGRWAEAAAPER